MNQGDRSVHLFWGLLRIGFILLPYVLYVGMAAIFSVLVYLLIRVRKLAFDPVTRYSLTAISGLLALGVITAADRGEAFLQLANFLPYFLFFGVLPLMLRGAQALEQVALDLVLASLPINLMAVVEYGLKGPWLPIRLRYIPLVDWIHSAPHRGRAMVMFDHPNTLANYLVLVLGLGLGLLLKGAIASRLSSPPSPAPASPGAGWMGWVAIATVLNLIGIFASGSRNGLVIAVLQLAIFISLVGHRLVRWLGLAGLAGLIAIAATLGIGGRSLAIAGWLNDPRVRVWQIAVELTGQRPWLGWGLGNYKIRYPRFPHDPDYPIVHHAHNVWLMLSSEAGLLVTIGLTALVGYICYRAVRVIMLGRRQLQDHAMLIGYLLAFLGCVAFAVFDVPFYDARINAVNWLILAGIYSYYSIDSNPGRS